MSNFSTMQDVRVRAVKSDGKGWMTIFTLFLGDNSFQGVTIVNLDASTVGLAIHLSDIAKASILEEELSPQRK